MAFLNDIIGQGKIKKEDKKRERYINYILLVGFILLMAWMLFYYPKTFIGIKVVLLILFIPGIPLTLLFYKKILTASGYLLFIKGNLKYNLTMAVLAYLLVTIPVGNVLVAAFLFGNYQFAQQETKTLLLKPSNIAKSYGRSGGVYNRTHPYSHLDVNYNGIDKQINFGDYPVDSIENKVLSVTVSEGLFGYYIIRKRRLISN